MKKVRNEGILKIPLECKVETHKTFNRWHLQLAQDFRFRQTNFHPSPQILDWVFNFLSLSLMYDEKSCINNYFNFLFIKFDQSSNHVQISSVHCLLIGCKVANEDGNCFFQLFFSSKTSLTLKAYIFLKILTKSSDLNDHGCAHSQSTTFFETLTLAELEVSCKKP